MHRVEDGREIYKEVEEEEVDARGNLDATLANHHCMPRTGHGVKYSKRMVKGIMGAQSIVKISEPQKRYYRSYTQLRE